MTEELISEELSTLLQAKGFDRFALQEPITIEHVGNSHSWYPGVTLSFVQKWLREVHSIFVFPELSTGGKWLVNVINGLETHRGFGNMPYFSNAKKHVNNYDGFDTYEESLEYGLKEAAKLL